MSIDFIFPLTLSPSYIFYQYIIDILLQCFGISLTTHEYVDFFMIL